MDNHSFKMTVIMVFLPSESQPTPDVPMRYWDSFNQSKYTEGELRLISDDYLMLRESNPISMFASSLLVELDENSHFEGISAASDLKEGDHISVEYREVNERKIACTICKETHFG